MDMKGKKCRACKKGKYIETSLWDDWDGKLHCSKCGHEVKRHQED
jgi:Zn ribbon nucleic-acid-binding protein